MSYKDIFLNSFIFIFVIVIQQYLPLIHLGPISVQPDILIVYLTFMTIINNRFQTIILGFCLGFLQDLLHQVSLVGLFCFIKSLSAYVLGFINSHKSLWSIGTKYFVVVLTYYIHFFFFFYIFTNDLTSIYSILKYSFFQAFSSFSIFAIMNVFIFRSRFI